MKKTNFNTGKYEQINSAAYEQFKEDNADKLPFICKELDDLINDPKDITVSWSVEKYFKLLEEWEEIRYDPTITDNSLRKLKTLIRIYEKKLNLSKNLNIDYNNNEYY